MTGKLPICVAIPVRDEADRLPECLSRLGRFADVVVIDSGSSDGTAAVAADHGARVIQFEWDGTYPKKRNWFLINHRPETEWVLFLDADEYLDPAAVSAIADATSRTDRVGFWLRYENRFMGRVLRYGLPQRKLALFRVGAGLYERIDETRWSGLDMEIHEHPVLDGPLGEISALIEHRDDRGMERFLAKHLDYAVWEARRAARLSDSPEAWAGLTERQRFKYRNLSRPWFATLYFLNAYVVRLGFLDGAAGFHYAFYKAWYFKTIRHLMLEQRDGTERGLGR